MGSHTVTKHANGDARTNAGGGSYELMRLGMALHTSDIVEWFMTHGVLNVSVLAPCWFMGRRGPALFQPCWFWAALLAPCWRLVGALLAWGRLASTLLAPCWSKRSKVL